MTTASRTRPRRGPLGALERHARCAAGRLRERWRRAVADPVPERRAEYAAELALVAAGALFEQEASRCPWCGDNQLSRRLRTRDVVQGKPGVFRLDECASCGHIFQNPRLNQRGLSYYYRDFYEGLGQRRTESMFQRSGRAYRARAAMLSGHEEPATWLDVGAGYGHFCRDASKAWPRTTFYGLDQSEAISAGARRGWVAKAYREPFVDFAGEHRDAFCAISMFHYLEHTLDPLRELEAVREALRPGGFLLIELPNPTSAFARLLGSFWHGWLIPQHLHMIPPANLVRALEARGFEVVELQLGAANQPFDLFGAAVSLVNYLVPSGRHPWIGREYSHLRTVLNATALLAAAPALALAMGVDQLLHLSTRRTAGGNTYRMLARKART